LIKLSKIPENELILFAEEGSAVEPRADSNGRDLLERANPGALINAR
jgi:hypothetical protein